MTRSGGSSGPSTVQYATTDGSATAGSDYVATSGTLSFASGEQPETITVLVNGDTTPESNETFAVNLSNPSGASFLTVVGTGTITNDDASNHAPVVATNAGLTVNISTTATIGNTKLKGTDADNDPITFTLLTATTKGTLKLNSTPLDVNGTFTQADIDANKLTYSAGGTTSSDSFDFKASDGKGGSVDGTFNITIVIDTPQSGASYVVNTTEDHDDGACTVYDCTLREAINAANSDGVESTITFDATVFATAQTINTNGSLFLNSNITITGPTAGVIVDAQFKLDSRPFDLDAGITVSISNMTITGGNVSNIGGGIYNAGTLTLTNCTVSNNICSEGFGAAGIYNGGTLRLNNCTIAGNHADEAVFSDGGGGIQNQGQLFMTNCTVSGNTADNYNGNGGGGIANYGFASIANCTITGNSSNFGSGGGSIYNGATLKLGNTIVAGNSGGDIVGPFTDLGNNLIDIDAKLGPLANNGGLTRTHALLTGSPAINAGSNALAKDANGNTLTTDQRGNGYPRIVGGTVDIGAFESDEVGVNALQSNKVEDNALESDPSS